MRDPCGDECVELSLGLAGVCGARAVLEFVSSLSDPDRPSQIIAYPGGKDIVATADGILHIAQLVGEADLMALSERLLAGITVRHLDCARR